MLKDLDNMEKPMMIKIGAIIAVIIVVVAACAVLLNSGDDGKNDSEAKIESSLMIRGNANNDYTIDSKDMEIVKDVKSGAKSLDDYPLADVDGDGEITQNDIDILQNMIDRKAGKVYVVTLDRLGNEVNVSVDYPLRNVVTYGTNMEMPLVYAGGGKYVAGYFNLSYDNAQSSITDKAVDLKGDKRKITDASWANFTKLDADLEKGIGAFLVDYSGISQITEARDADLKAAGIPMLSYKSADSVVDSATVLTLSYLFGTDTEDIGQKYAQLRDKVISEIDSKLSSLSDVDRTTFIAFNMYYYVCGPDSTYASTSLTAHGKPYSEVNADFAAKYQNNSTPMESVEALSNYKDVDALVNIRSIDWVSDAKAANDTILETWDHKNKGGLSSEYFKGFEDRLTYINNLLPGPAKLAYTAAALYGEYFSFEWADGILQECIDMGLEPLKEYTIDQLVPYFDYAKYQACKA